MSGLYPMNELRVGQPYPIAQGLYPMEEQRIGQPYPIAQGLYPMEQIAAGPHYGPMVPGARSIAGAKARRCKGGRIWHPLLGTCVLARPAKLSKKAKAKAKKAKAIAGWNVNMRPYPCNGAM